MSSEGRSGGCVHREHSALGPVPLVFGIESLTSPDRLKTGLSSLQFAVLTKTGVFLPHGQESLRALTKRCGINQKTVAKWKKRSSVADVPTGPREAHSTVLSLEDEAVIVAFRRHTLLPLDDCLYALQPTIPHLTRSSQRRCFQRHGVSRLPDTEGDKPARKK